jgi:hypothetical protein
VTGCPNVAALRSRGRPKSAAFFTFGTTDCPAYLTQIHSRINTSAVFRHLKNAIYICVAFQAILNGRECDLHFVIC